MSFANGDKCPCCGAKIQNKNKEWLRLFGRLCDALGLEKEEEIVLEPISTPDFPPPDAGLNPPVNPKV